MLEHNTITDPYLHEPKGASTALNNTVYVANGSGTGSWKSFYTLGVEDYNNDGAAQALTTGAWTKLTNNTLGANTNILYKIPGWGSVWSPSTNEFIWVGTGLSLGDTVDIRADVAFNTAGANTRVGIRLDLGVGSASPYSLIFYDNIVKTASEHNPRPSISVYLGNSVTLNYPAAISAFTDGTGDTVNVNGWFIRTQPRRPVLA